MTVLEQEFYETVIHSLRSIDKTLQDIHKNSAQSLEKQPKMCYNNSEGEYTLTLTPKEFAMVYDAVCIMNIDMASGLITDYSKDDCLAMENAEKKMLKMIK